MVKNYVNKVIATVEHLSENSTNACATIGFCRSGAVKSEKMVHLRHTMKKLWKTKVNVFFFRKKMFSSM